MYSKGRRKQAWLEYSESRGEWLGLQRCGHSQILGSLKEFGFYPESIRKPSKSCKQGSNV